MELLSYFGQIVVYFIVFVILYFSFDKLMQSKLYLRLKIPKQLNDFIFGIFLGCFNLIASYGLGTIGTIEIAPIYFFLSLVLAFFKSYQSALYSLAPVITYYTINYPIDELFYFNVASTFTMILIVQILNNLYTKPIIAFGIFSTLVVMIFFGLLFSFTIFDTDNMFFILEYGPYAMFINLVCFFLFYYLFNFSISSNLLYASSNFTFMRYYRPGISKMMINKFIQKEKISYGALSVLDFNFPLQKSNAANKEIRLSILESLSKLLPERAILFNLLQDTYGFFLPFENNKHDVEQDLRELLARIPRKHRLPWKKTIYVNIRSGVAIYGKDNNEISTLFNYAVFALNTMPNRQNLHFFNSKLWLRNVQETELLNLLDAALPLDGFTNNYTSLWNIKKKQDFGYWIDQENISQYSLHENIVDIIYYQNWHTIFFRYFANEVIKNVKRKAIFFYYDLAILEQHFDIDNFLFQLRKEKIRNSNVFLIIAPYAYDKVKNPQLVREKIKALENHGISFIVSNDLPSQGRKFFSRVKYSYVLQNIKKKNFPNSLLISPEISSIEMLREHLAKGVDIIGGPLFIKKNSVTKFDKQSKMYIEKVLSRLSYE